MSTVMAQSVPMVPLATVLRVRNDVIHPRDLPEGRAIFTGLEHVEPHTGRLIGSLEIDLAKMTGRRAKYFAGDLVYGYLRPYLNKVFVAKTDGMCSVDQYVFTVDAELADTEYVAHYMRSGIYLERAPIDAAPGQLPRIRTEEVLSTPIPLPPLDEQRRIVARLEAQLAAADAFGASTQNQVDDNAELVSDAVDAELHDELDTCVPLSQLLASPLAAGLSKPEDAASPYRGLTLGAVRGREIDYAASKPVQATAREAAANQMEPRTLYVVRGNGNVNLVGRGAATGDEVPPSTIYPDLLIRVRPDESQIALEYLRLVWHTRFVREQIVAAARTAAGIYKINQQNLSAILVPSPCMEAQRRRVARVEELIEVGSVASSLQAAQSQAITDLRSALLRETFA